MITDMTGRNIEVGDVVLFTRPGAGRNLLPPLVFGEVIGMTNASVRVHNLNKDFSRVQVEEREDDLSQPPYHISSTGKSYYRKRGTGRYRDADPVAVKHYTDRFFIVRKI